MINVATHVVDHLTNICGDKFCDIFDGQCSDHSIEQCIVQSGQEYSSDQIHMYFCV